MATATFFSQHSSNPLEVPSSDIRNKTYLHKYKAAKVGNDHDSDELSHGGAPPELQAYHSHLAQLYTDRGTERPTHQYQRREQPGEDLIDLDAEMESDGEKAGSDAGSIMDADSDEAEDDDDSDAEGEVDDEFSLYLRPREEQEEILAEMNDLSDAVTAITPDYKLVDRLGTGTFSSVYKALDLGYHRKWDNAVWHGRHLPTSSAYYQSAARPPDSKVFVAIKRIYVTSNPERIRNEIAIMEDCRGARHVSQLITAFRQEDQVVAIMPYHRNSDFRDFFRTLPIDGIKSYFRCMFRALRDIHAREIIHRDVKPANFLFDPETGIGTLCDFGLACRMDTSPSQGTCLHTAPTKDHPHGQVRNKSEYDIDLYKKLQREARQRSQWSSDRVGYPEKDVRPHSKANRAGTRGFRAPEVLLKCSQQSGAIDIWAAGTILLFFLAGKFPLFQSQDDIEALMEIAAIVGRKKMERVATLHSRTFTSNVPSITQDGISWHDFVERQNPDLRVPPKPVKRFFPYSVSAASRSSHPPPPSSSSPGMSTTAISSSPSPPSPETYAFEIMRALDLVEHLMHPDASQRMTPRMALAHPFLMDGDDDDDDEYFPHPFGEGVCGAEHIWVPDSDERVVRIQREDGKFDMRIVTAGEGVAIGHKPCELHADDPRFELSW